MKGLFQDYFVIEDAPISVWKPKYPKAKDPEQVKYGNHKRLSQFSVELAKRILSFYAPPSSRVWDPFSGNGTRRTEAEKTGHKYEGVDLSEGIDSTEYKSEGEFDFSYTCPPYWNVEIYSDDPKDLSNAPTYEQFLCGIEKVLKISYEILKSNSFCAWVVGNFREKKSGTMFHFNGDVVRLAEKIGFVLWDEVIWWGASDAAYRRIGKFVKNRKIIRVHEYVEVFKKE